MSSCQSSSSGEYPRLTGDVTNHPFMTQTQLAVQFFFQIAVILAFCQLVGLIAKRFGQPQVVAEMIAGVLLGPSLLGLFWPGFAERIFPPESMKVLFPVSQLGLAAYMFVVGLEFRVDIVRHRLHSAVAVSIAGMVTPFVLGAGLGWYLFHHTELFPAKTSLLEATLFLGASMCITAFPMLARIIHFKNLAGTTMGTVALGAGAIDDAAAWCLWPWCWPASTTNSATRCATSRAVSDTCASPSS